MRPIPRLRARLLALLAAISAALGATAPAVSRALPPVSPGSFSGGPPAGDPATAAVQTAALTPGFSPAGMLAPKAEAEGTDVRVNDFLGDHFTPCTTQSETSLVALDANRIVVGFNDSAEACLTLDSFTGFAYSEDGGRTFTDGGRMAPPPGGMSGGDPSLVADRHGRIYLATLGNDSGFIAVPRVRVLPGRSSLLVYRSDDGGKTWMTPVDGTTGISGLHDKELLAVDNTGGPHDGTVYLAWVEFPGNAPGRIRFSRSTNRGDSFSTPITLSRNDADQNMGPYPVVGPNGEVYVIWQTQVTTSPAIYFTASLDGGQTFSFPRKIRTLKAPGRSLSCNRQGMQGNIRMLAWPVIGVDHTPIVDPQNPPPHRGTIYVAYASTDGPDEGNIFVIRSKDGGFTWNPPSPSLGIKVNDDVTTRDQFMPAIANKPNGEVALVWYDRRSDPNDSLIEIFAARSLDGGITWSQNLKVSDVAFEGLGNSFTRDPGTVECYMGDYHQVIPFNEGYAAAWGDNRDKYPADSEGFRSDPNVYFDKVSFPGGG